MEWWWRSAGPAGFSEHADMRRLSQTGGSANIMYLELNL